MGQRDDRLVVRRCDDCVLTTSVGIWFEILSCAVRALGMCHQSGTSVNVGGPPGRLISLRLSPEISWANDL